MLGRASHALAFAAALALVHAGSAAQESGVAQRGGEAAVERKVTEDDGVRIEELRVRGQTQRIVVRSKLGNVRAYEILAAPAARDLSQEKGASGQRVWHILSF